MTTICTDDTLLGGTRNGSSFNIIIIVQPNKCFRVNVVARQVTEIRSENYDDDDEAGQGLRPYNNIVFIISYLTSNFICHFAMIK